MTVSAETSATGRFDGSRARFETLLGFLEGDGAAALSHSELEARLDVDGRELLCGLFQDHLELRADREQRVEAVADADGVPRRAAERGHERALTSVFGELSVRRLAYRRRGCANLHPADGLLNLPCERHSHGLRRLAAVESSRGSFDDAVEAIERVTGQRVAKRQVEHLAARAAIDFDAFYAQRQQTADPDDDVLVVSCDGKGVVMRHDALRPATAKQAAKATSKLQTRLSKGEKRNRKRMAEVGTVYDAPPAPRTAAEVLPATDDQRAQASPGPVAANKWLTASVVENAAEVVGRVFDEAERRDPAHQRQWVALVDGSR